MNKILFYVFLAVFSSSIPNQENNMPNGVFVCKTLTGTTAKIESDLFE